MGEALVDYELDDRVASLRMDDGKANALSHGMIDELNEALDRAESEAGAVLLAGRPGRFCAGFDLRTMLSGVDAARELVTRGAHLYLRLYEYPLPVLMACTGHAVAGGAVLLLAGDVRLAPAGDFKIGLNEIAIGMPLPVFVQDLARERLDPRQLVAATLRATLFNPEQAKDVGFLDEVVPAAELARVAHQRATELAKLPAQSYGPTKQRMREATVRQLRTSLADDMARLTPPTG